MTVEAEALGPERLLALQKLAREGDGPGIQSVSLHLRVQSLTPTASKALDGLCEGLSHLKLDVLTLQLTGEGLGTGEDVHVDLGALQQGSKDEPAQLPQRLELVMPASDTPHAFKLRIAAPQGVKVLGMADNFFLHKPFVQRVDQDRRPVGEPQVLRRVPYLGKGSDMDVHLNGGVDFILPGGLLPDEQAPPSSAGISRRTSTTSFPFTSAPRTTRIPKPAFRRTACGLRRA